MVIANNLVTDELVINSIKRNLAIIRFDLNRKVAYVNGLFAQILGYTVEEMYEKDMKSFVFLILHRAQNTKDFGEIYFLEKVFKIKWREWMFQKIQFG